MINFICKKQSIKTIFGIYLLVGIYIYKDFGINIEEHWQRLSGFYWLNYVYEFFNIELFKEIMTSKYLDAYDSALPDPQTYKTYGPTFDLTTAFIEVIFNIKSSKVYFELRHLLIFFIFFLSSITFYKILLHRFRNKIAIFFGVLFYIISPRIFGDSFHNNKDILLLSLIVFSVFFIFRYFENKKILYLILVALFSALVTSTRFYGFFIPLTFIIFLFINSKKNIINNFTTSIYFLFFYFCSLTLHWPLMWESPFKTFLMLLTNYTKGMTQYQILYKGDYFFTFNLPIDYVFTWIIISTPIFLLALFFSGYFFLLKRSFNRLIKIDPKKKHLDLFLGNNEKKDFYIFLNFTLLAMIIFSFNFGLTSGWRHFYFLHIFIIYMGTFFIQLLFRKYRENIKYLVPLFLIFSVLVIFDLYKFHPYQSLYFNEFITNEKKNNYQVDMASLSRIDSLNKILELEKDTNNKIKVGTASYTPYENAVDKLDENLKKKFIFTQGNFQDADYIYSNMIFEVDTKYNDKYNIPSNFELVYEKIIDQILIYKLYKKI